MSLARPGDDPDLSRAFGAVLRELRSESGLSQEALASAAGLDRTYVGGLERGERNPTLKVMWALSVALDVSLTRLVSRIEEVASG